MVLHFHSVGLLIIVSIFFALVQCQPQIVFISPDPKKIPCDDKLPCMTLSQYASQPSGQSTSGAILRFLPGDHRLTRVLNASNLSSFTMVRAFNNTPKTVIKISCQYPDGHFEFSSIQSVNMNDLQLEGCSGNTVSAVTNFVLDNLFIYGGQDNFERVLSVAESIVTIIDCNFTHNKGGGLLINSSIVTINRSNFNNNEAPIGCSIYVDTNNTVSITNSTFENNRVYQFGGGVYVNTNDVISISNSIFNNNYNAYGGGGIYVNSNSTISVTNSTFDSNNAKNGGGVYVNTTSIVSITNSTFAYNRVDQFGGGIYVLIGNIVSITDSIFDNNIAVSQYGGGIYVITDSTVSITNSIFASNCAAVGGAVHVQFDCTIFITNSTFNNNIANVGSGGGVYVGNDVNTACISNCTFHCNSAKIVGGGIAIDTNSTVSIVNSTFDNNHSVQFGGGGGASVYINNTLSFVNCIFYDNSGSIGGGIRVDTNNTVSVSNSIFDSNSAKDGNGDGGGGGSIFIITNNNVSITNSTFNNNSAVDRYGGGVHVDKNNTVSITDSTFNNNSADMGGGVYVAHSTVEFRGNINMTKNIGNQSIVHIVQSSVFFSGQTNIENNDGSVFALSSNIVFFGRTKFYQNSQPKNSIFQGGLITTLRSNASFMGYLEMLNNTADKGGAISAIQSNVYIYGSAFIENNKARLSGGGIYAYLSQFDFHVIKCSIKGNTAVEEGGGIHAVGSTVSLSNGSLLITENTANLGGGMCLELNAKLMIFTEDPDIRNSLKFTQNVAQLKGGAIYVADNTLSGTCAGNDSSINECFFQALQLYSSYKSDFSPMKDIAFSNNTANDGGTLYGGLLDRCIISPFVENYADKYRDATGSAYFQDVTEIEDPKNNSIASDPVRVCFCSDKPNCNNSFKNISVRKGHSFNFSVVAVDQVERPISQDNNGVIIHAFLSNVSQGSGLKEGQTSQREDINGSCTQLQYNIVSLRSSEELVLYAEGPCKDVGISRLVISVHFIECTCQDGFKPLPSNFNCSCDCDPKLLMPHTYVEKCSSADSTLLRSGTSWISYIHNCTDSLNSRNCSNSSSAGYVVNLYCPYDYCKPSDHRVYINLSMPNGSDAQCAFKRSGKLCGSCEGGLSHSLGSSQCMLCTNTWLALLLPFSLAGIALVVFILMFNLTVAIGTINGLIFYANVIAANQATFLPFDKPNILTVFIAWHNLDLGIETCFYNGMNAYAKILLQFAFPVYIILLIFVIIVICRLSERFANLIGSKNPVATLATLFLLSYTKLLRSTITVLNFSYLNHLNDGSKELIWPYDANVAYLKGKHIPLFIAAVLIIIVGMMYTFLLLFWQWLQHCSNWRGLRWMNNTKLKALMDAYHAPYQSNHRYWTGLILLVRVVLYLVSTLNFSRDPSVYLFSVSCVLAVLLSLKLVCTQSKVYKNWALDALDTSCILNLLLFAIASFYLLHIRGVNAELHKGNQMQVSLAYTSTSISFAIFLTLLMYHSYTFCLSKMNLCKTFLEKLQITNKPQRAYKHEELSGTSSDSSDEEEAADLRSELCDIVPEPPNTDDYRQVVADQRRARAFERRRVRSKKQEVTYTVVEISQPELLQPEMPLPPQIRDSPVINCSPLQLCSAQGEHQLKKK